MAKAADMSNLASTKGAIGNGVCRVESLLKRSRSKRGYHFSIGVFDGCCEYRSTILAERQVTRERVQETI
jgi:hypothetical protein